MVSPSLRRDRLILFPMLLSAIFASYLPAGQYPLWELDETLSGQTHGAMGVWNGLLWGLNHEGYQIWTYDGSVFGLGGRLPQGYKPFRPLFTDQGMFVVAREGHPDGGKSVHVMRSPDGFEDFETLLSFDYLIGSTPLENSIVDLGQRRLLYIDYGNDSSVYYSADNGDSWNRVFQPVAGSVKHFHGAFFDSEYEKLYLMSGDSNSESSIMVCDNVFGQDGLLNNPAMWVTRWGMADPSRSTLDEDYLLDPDGIVASQRTRTVDMIIDGDYIYWGEDTGHGSGQSVFRVHRQSMDVEQIGERGIIGAPWSFLRTSAGDLLFVSASIHYGGRIIPGHDEYVRIYAFNEQRTDWAEITRFERKTPFYDTAFSLGFFEARDRVWVYGYEFPQEVRDIVGRLFRYALPGDFDSNGVLDVTDIDLLSRAISDKSTDLQFDVNADGAITWTDQHAWIHDLKKTFIGDANVDGEFNTADFVQVLERGKYETPECAAWSEGDWNGDGVFDTGDFVVAFEDGGYERGPRMVAVVVPEPDGWVLCLLGMTLLWRRSR